MPDSRVPADEKDRREAQEAYWTPWLEIREVLVKHFGVDAVSNIDLVTDLRKLWPADGPVSASRPPGAGRWVKCGEGHPVYVPSGDAINRCPVSTCQSSCIESDGLGDRQLTAIDLDALLLAVSETLKTPSSPDLEDALESVFAKLTRRLASGENPERR